jgi:hypothetical protein
MANSLNGNVFADKGYLSKQLSQTLQQQNVKLITRVRKKGWSNTEGCHKEYKRYKI